jgi:hypothetical protein
VRVQIVSPCRDKTQQLIISSLTCVQLFCLRFRGLWQTLFSLSDPNWPWAYRSHSRTEWRCWTAMEPLDSCLASERTIKHAWWSHDRTAAMAWNANITSLLSDWLCLDGWHLLSWSTSFHGLETTWCWRQQRKRGRPDPALDPSQGNSVRRLRRSMQSNRAK